MVLEFLMPSGSRDHTGQNFAKIFEIAHPTIAVIEFRNATSPLHSTATAMTTQQGAISKRRKFVADGVFYAELNELFQRELAEEGYSGVEVRVTPTVTDISMPLHLASNAQF